MIIGYEIYGQNYCNIIDSSNPKHRRVYNALTDLCRLLGYYDLKEGLCIRELGVTIGYITSSWEKH